MPRSFLIKKSPARNVGAGNTNGAVKRPWIESQSENKEELTSTNASETKGPFDLSTKVARKSDEAIKESAQLSTTLHHIKVTTPPPGTTLVDPSKTPEDASECSPKYGTPLEPLNPNTGAPLRTTWNRSPVAPYIPSDSSVYHYQRHHSTIDSVYAPKPTLGTNGYHGPPFLVPPPLVPVSHAQPPTSSTYRLEQLSPLTRDDSLYYCDNPSSKMLHHNSHLHQDMYNAWSTDAAKAVVPSPPPSSSDGEYTVDVVDDGKKRKCEAPRYQCCDCNKSYSTYSGLSKHRQFHCLTQSKKSFNCKYCDKVYVSLGALKMHIRTHTLPCKCKLCGKAFSRPWLLQGHIRTHTGEKPFACPHCSRAFADRSNLRAHLQTHSDVKKYSCKTCSKTFSRMSLLLKHEDGGCIGNKNV